MRICYAQDSTNSARPLSTVGIFPNIIANQIEKICSINVCCPTWNKSKESTLLEKIRPIETYRHDSTSSLIFILKLIELNYDPITVTLSGTIIVHFSLTILPDVLKTFILIKIFHLKNFKVINNPFIIYSIEKLGYGSLHNRVQRRILSTIESHLLQKNTIFALLMIYKKLTYQKVAENKIEYPNSLRLETIKTVPLNETPDKHPSEIVEICESPNILFQKKLESHKGIELDLRAPNSTKEIKMSFNLMTTKSANQCFSFYEIIHVC